MTFKDKINAEYKNIVQASHTNAYIVKIKLLNFSKDYSSIIVYSPEKMMFKPTLSLLEFLLPPAYSVFPR